MADTRYLKRRGETWFFALAVPRDLRLELGRERVVTSLKTRDLAVAQARRWPKLIEAQEAFAKLSGAKRLPADEALDPQTLLDVDEFARRAYRDALKAMQDDAIRGVRITAEVKNDGRPHAREVEGLNMLSTELWLQGELDRFAPVAEPLAAYCERNAIDIGSNLYRLVGRSLLRAHIGAVEGRRLALSGEVSDEPNTFLEFAPIDPVTLKPLRAAGSWRLIFAEVALALLLRSSATQPSN